MVGFITQSNKQGTEYTYILSPAGKEGRKYFLSSGLSSLDVQEMHEYLSGFRLNQVRE